MLAYPIPRNHVTVRLMTRDYADSLLLHREQQTVIGGLWVITGFRQIGTPVNKLTRADTNYSLRRRWHMLIDSITSFSEVPLVAIFYLGIAISALSVVVGVGLIVHKIIFRGAIEGWVSVMLSVWLLGGLLILSIGVIGIYISKIFRDQEPALHHCAPHSRGGAVEASAIAIRTADRGRAARTDAVAARMIFRGRSGCC